MDKGTKKIGIVDDHEFFRSGLKVALKRIKDIEVIYEVDNGEEFLNAQSESPADLVLMDIKMPVMDGYEATLEAKKRFPELKIMILSMFDTDEYIRNLVEAGVNGFVLKNINKIELENAILQIFKGQQYYSQELMAFFTRQFLVKEEDKNGPDELTKRELEVLQLIFQGYSNKEIADKLFISVRTVTNHRANLNAKTNSKNTASLISFALRNKLVK